MEKIRLATIALLIAFSATASANGDRGGGSSGGGNEQLPFLTNDGGAPGSFVDLSRAVYLNCPSGLVVSCPECKGFIGLNNQPDTLALQSICLQPELFNIYR